MPVLKGLDKTDTSVKFGSHGIDAQSVWSHNSPLWHNSGAFVPEVDNHPAGGRAGRGRDTKWTCKRTC